MRPRGPLDLMAVAEMEQLISKIAHKAPAESFTARERELMEQLRQSQDVILPQLHEAMHLYKGANDRGREKLKNLIEGIERICTSGLKN